jgi:apolipoprotein N-acyltransferase
MSVLWQDAKTPRLASMLGFAFGFGLFGTGVSWVYIALNTFGGMPLPVAAVCTAGFCAYLALFPAAAGWLCTRWTAPGSWERAIAAAALWTVMEWLRSWLFSGFGWLSLGYSQLPGSPLAGYAPVGGVFLVSIAVSVCAACVTGIMLASVAPCAGLHGSAGRRDRRPRRWARIFAWTSPVGEPVTVSLVQGNVTQDVKFDPEFRPRTFELYSELVNASRGRLVVLPESAFPVFADEMPEQVLLDLLRTVAARDGDIMVGLFTLEAPLPGHDEPRYYNSVVTLGTAESQLYRKRHLVPFGETIPLEPVVGWIMRSLLSIPLASQSSGDPDPPALAIAGQKVAVNICYEDAFGADIRPQAAAATLLVNVTNDAWYGRSIAAEQHDQIAAMRALETGRPLLRATNTGITSAIAHNGREIARLPWFTRGILEVEVTGREGVTPYVRFGDAPAVVLAALLCLSAVLAARRKRGAM